MLGALTLNACVYCCYCSIYVCGKEMEERGQGGPSGLVPIWHGVDPAARNSVLGPEHGDEARAHLRQMMIDSGMRDVTQYYVRNPAGNKTKTQSRWMHLAFNPPEWQESQGKAPRVPRRDWLWNDPRGHQAPDFSVKGGETFKATFF
jgi:hypothetical protein